MDCSQPSSSVHGILQGNLPDPGIESGSPALQADALLSDPEGKPETKHLTYLSLRFLICEI